MDLSKLVHFEMTSKTRELVNTKTSLVENVYLEVLVQHADLKEGMSDLQRHWHGRRGTLRDLRG